jgi:hypothetical protein
MKKMNLLFYATGEKGTGKRLWDLHQELSSVYKGAFCRTIDTLSLKLRKSMSDLTIAVLLAENQEELLDILSIRDLLNGVRIILILPDRKEDTIRKGHSLYPRFLNYVDGDFKNVVDVLAKMLKNMNSSNNIK